MFFLKILIYFFLLVSPLPYLNTNSFATESRFLMPKTKMFNGRTGPSLRYPIKFTYMRPDLPLKEIEAAEDWIKIEDLDGDTAWIQSNILGVQKKRINVAAAKKSGLECFEDKNLTKKIFTADFSVTMRLLKCENDLCLVQKNRLKGWCHKKSLWGT